jgi:HEAT repeat protein
VVSRRRVAAAGWVAVAVWLLSLLSLSPVAHADARSDYLVRLLAGSTQFRVRAQAAISLGSVEAAPNVVDALAKALSDEHPAVRAAAANSLGRLGDPRALSSLRARSNDPEIPVRTAVKAAITRLESAAPRKTTVAETPKPTGPPRYYVAVATPATRVPDLPPAALAAARQTLRDRLAEMDGVVLAPNDESVTAARGVVKARKLKGFYVESSVTAVEPKSGGTRVAVSVILATYPDRAMRAIMQGAATALGGGDTRGQAMSSAFRSALNQLPAAMARE